MLRRSASHRFLQPALAMALALMAASPFANAEEGQPVLVPGERFPMLDLEDQFGDEHAVPGEATLIIFSGSKQADDDLSGTLGEIAGDALRAGEIIYLSDISRMPGLITKLIAMPALKDRDYPVTLIREEGVADTLPATDGCVTLFQLSGEGEVHRIDEACEPDELRDALTADGSAPGEQP
ncbi:MAG: hypothetical protein ACLFMY_00820 [Guyparkeria sp.]|uniref:hypothetical protein n=1 Tax=Guyparkeria sp. TaxID=2035736 RepID=UPI00397816B2